MAIQEQTVRARAVQGSAALGVTGTGKEQIGVLFELLEGPDEGKHITWYGYFTDAAVDRTLESLRHMGWQGHQLMDLSTIGDADAPDVTIVIEYEADQQGELRPKVRWVNKLSNGVAMKERMDENQARAFSERMKGKVLSMNRGQGSAPAPSSASSKPATRPSTQRTARGKPPARQDGDPGIGDDDIPF